MTYEEFQRHIGKAGLRLGEFARLMGMHPNSITNKKARGVPRHLAVIAVLLGEMAERGIDFRAVLARAELQEDAPEADGAE